MYRATKRTCQHSSSLVYGAIFNAAFWRLPSAGGDAWSTVGFKSSLAGASEIRYDRGIPVVLALVGRTEKVIASRDFSFIQDLWATHDKVYREVRDLYRTEQKDMDGII